MDIVPAPLKQLYYFVVLLPTPRENLQNLICTCSCFMFLFKLNRKRSSLLILLTIDVPHTSLPYNSTAFTVWSNMCKSVFIFSLYKLKLFLNLSNAFNPLLYKSSLASAELPLELRYTMYSQIFIPFCSFNRYIIYIKYFIVEFSCIIKYN